MTTAKDLDLRISVKRSPHGWNYITVSDGKRIVPHSEKGGRLATNLRNAVRKWRTQTSGKGE